MLDDLKPTTLSGIKRLATRLKRSDGLTHQDALDEAARRSGFENLRHAQNMLAGAGARPAKHRLYVTTRWKRNPTGDWGTETLVVDLGLPIAELIPVRAFADHLADGDVPAPDHFVCPTHWSNAEHARYAAARIARYLQFIDATGLWPTGAFQAVYRDCKIWGDDPTRTKNPLRVSHDSCWFDPLSGRSLLANNPYRNEWIKRKAEVAEWADRVGVDIADMPEWSLHTLDYDCRLQFISNKATGVPVEEVVRALTSGPAPIDPNTAEFISLERQDFVSPLGLEARSERGRQVKPAPRRSARPAGTPYVTAFHTGMRSEGTMRMADHHGVGGCLRTAYKCLERRAGARNGIREACFHLGIWAPIENPEFFQTEAGWHLYDVDQPIEGRTFDGEDPDRGLFSLNMALALIEKRYVDSVARDQVLKPLLRAHRSASSWNI